MNNNASFHPYLRTGWGISTVALEKSLKPTLPDVNPADEVVARMRLRMRGGDRGTVIPGIAGSLSGNFAGGGNGRTRS